MMKNRRTLLFILVTLLWGAVSCTSAAPSPNPPADPTSSAPAEPTKLKVLYAGSLIIPFEALERVYEEQAPEVDVLMEGHGSIQVIRHITELDELVDVAVLADYSLVPAMMYENNVPETGQAYADWTIQFATNRMVLAYTPESQYAAEIDNDNWYQIIARDDVRLGLSDPRFDACGYRGLMVLQLAEPFYDRITVLENVVMGRFTNAITSQEEGGRTLIHVPEVLQPKSSSNLLVRSYSVQLIALLEAREIDYAFAYETVARQHGLEYLPLPAELNLGSEAHSEDYQSVGVALDFQRFATVPPRFVGETIGYGITIPSNAPHPDLAEEFIAYLLGPDGRAMMEANGHPLFEQPYADAPEQVPPSLQTLLRE